MKQIILGLAFLLLVIQSTLVAQSPAALEAIPAPAAADVVTFRQHVDWLASPFLKGRVAGTPEMEYARHYIEWHFQQAGLEPVFAGANPGDPKSYRQPFELGARRELKAASLAVGDMSFDSASDFRGMISGDAGSASGELVFAGYGISKISDWKGLEDEDDFSGKIVVVYAYGPMDAEGKSLYPGRRGRGWPREADPFFKGAGMRDRGAKAVLMVIPPGVADDGRGLDGVRDRSMQTWNSPLLTVTTAAFEKILAAGKSGETAASLRAKADAGRVVLDLGVGAKLAVEIESTPRLAENVGGIIPGRGDLADEYVVVGAHIDHLGLGMFGSRAGPEGRGKIHPGADDNASGTAAIMMMAERLVAHYKAQPDDANLRSVLFLGFDAEEQGLLGARHYVKEPIAPLEKHALMINFDMIGRITDRQLKVDGATSGSGLAELVRPLFADSGLVIKEGESVMMASDHAAFYSVGVPVLFGIITPFHNEYHTPRDTSDKMNCVDAVRVVDLFDKITRKVAAHPAPIEFTGQVRGGRRN